jgi:predicted Zn-dependent protease
LQQAAHQHDWLIVGELAVAMVMHGLTREGAEKAEWLTLAMKLIDGATRAGTDEPIVWINHAWILKRANHADAACAALDRAVELLRAGRGDLAGLSATLLREGDIVNQARARLFVSPALDEPALVVRLRRFMLHHALVELGQLHLEAARGETAEAALREAVSLEESFGPPRARLAEVLHRRGAIDAGIAELERALTDDPLHDVPAWARLVERLSAQDPTRGAALADELRVICDAMPIEPLLQLKRSLPSGS